MCCPTMIECASYMHGTKPGKVINEAETHSSLCPVRESVELTRPKPFAQEHRMQAAQATTSEARRGWI